MEDVRAGLEDRPRLLKPIRIRNRPSRPVEHPQGKRWASHLGIPAISTREIKCEAAAYDTRFRNPLRPATQATATAAVRDVADDKADAQLSLVVAAQDQQLVTGQCVVRLER